MNMVRKIRLGKNGMPVFAQISFTNNEREIDHWRIFRDGAFRNIIGTTPNEVSTASFGAEKNKPGQGFLAANREVSP